MDKKKKTWIIIGGCVLVLLSFLLSDSVRHTFTRKRAIRAAEAELARLTQEAEEARQQITNLETNPKATERLVRKELGYLKPGEKEVRFVNK